MAALMDPRLAGTQQLGAVAYAGFPVRKFTQKLNNNSGEWVIAYQADQRRHLQAVIVPLVKEHARTSKILRSPTNTREASGVPRKVLDKLFLLKHCYGREPSDLCVCNVSGKELQDYKYEDFAQFINVVSINASDNHLPLEAFHAFPVLEELELSLNGIVDVVIEPGYLTSLHTLDLSYNSLSEWALLALGTLPLLKELHLTGNNIVALPVEMSRPYPTPNQSSGTEMRYPSLEKVWLDENKLTDQATFATLAGMRKLKYLNLDNNEIYMIPHLKLLGTSPLKPAKSTEQATNSSLNGTPDLIHSRSTLPVSREGDQADSNRENDRTEETVLAAIASDDQVAADKGNISTEQGGEDSDPLSVKSEPSLVHQTTENVTGIETKNRLEQVEEVVPNKQLPKNPLHLQVPSTKSEPCLVRQMTEINSKVEAKKTSEDKVLCDDASGEQSPKNPLHSEVLPSGHTTANATPPLHTITTPPTQINQSARTSSKSVTEKQGRVGNLQPVSGEDETLKELAPFPQLETLSLINNLILREEGVLACCTWPVLKELIIYDNPFTQTLKGMPPLLKSHLVDQCGITVVRKKPGQQRRHHIGKAAKDFKKVSSAPPPTIPKYPLPALEAPPMSSRMLEGIPSFPPSPSSSHHSFSRSISPSTSQHSSLGENADPVDTESEASQLSGAGTRAIGKDGQEKTAQDKDLQGVFLTQVDGEEPIETAPGHSQTEGMSISMDQGSVREEFKARVKELKHKYKTLPSQYRGYEALLNTFEDPAVSVPQDLYGCTRALQHALKHPLVLSDSHSKAPSVSSHSDNSSQMQPTGQYLKKKPAVMAVVPTTVQTNHKLRQLQECLDEIRTQCNTVETNLASVLAPKHGLEDSANGSVGVMSEARRSIDELQRESRKLLAEMQARYDQVRSQSLSGVQAMSAELQRHSSRKKRTPKSSTRVTFSSEGTV